MSRELEALHNLYARASVHCPIDEISIILDELHIIKNVLKALKIIKEKRVDVGWLISCENIEQYNNVIGTATHKLLTQKEFNLLKEILLWD